MSPRQNRTERIWRIHPALFYGVPLVALALFCTKPLHIDDALFLRMGDLLPFHLIAHHAGGRVEFLGKIYENLSPYESTHPPLIPWLLKVIDAVPWGTRFPFAAYHVGFLIFPAMALFFARRYVRAKRVSPHWVLFLIGSPLYFVNATNLMTDVAMVTFWLGAVVFATRSAESHSSRDAWLSGAMLFLALMTSYQSIALVPLLTAFLMMRGAPAKRYVYIILLPFVLFVLYLAAVYAVSGFFPFFSSQISYNIGSEVKSGMGLSHYLHKSTATLTFLGLGLAVPTPLLLISVNKRRLLEHIVFASILAFTLYHLSDARGVFSAYSNQQVVWLRVLMLIGAIWSFQVLAKCVDGFRLLLRDRRRSSRLLLPSFWFLGVVTYNVLFMPYTTARYVLPAVPPALLLLFAHPLYRLSRIREGIFIAIGFFGSMFMARVDFQQARADYVLYRQVVQDVSDPQQLWFSDDNGLNRYLNQAGAHYLPADTTELEAGDYLLVTRGMVHPDIETSLSFVKHYSYDAYAGLTLFDTDCKAGFYRSYDGLLPIAPCDHVRMADLYRVNGFLKNISRAKVMALSNPNYFGRTVFTFPDGVRESVMYMHPDARVHFALEEGATRIRGRALTAPDSWRDAGDGVQFQVGVLTERGEQVLWDRFLDAKKNPSDRAGATFDLAIPPGATELWFSVAPGPAGDYRFDTAGWADIQIDPAP